MSPASTTTTMRAWRVRRPGPIDTGPLEQVTTEVPHPKPSELLVAVRACGVCRTDLHVSEGDLPVHREHVTPGHEVVGEVVQVGSEAGTAGGDFQVGDRVGIAWLRHTCGACKYCQRGDENLCPQSRYTGWDADGGYAEFCASPAERVQRQRTCATVMRGHHRLPLAAACRTTTGWPTRNLWLRRQCAHHGAGRVVTRR